MAARARRAAIAGGLARIVLISDGQANEGLWDRGELAQLVANTASHGVSVSTVGVGLDFDEVTMTQLAEVGRGNYYFVEDTANLSAMFAREIDGLSETVASNVQLVLTPSAGVTIAEAYGYPLTRQGTTVAVPIADLRGGETHKVVLRLEVTSPVLGPLVVTQVQVGWRRVFDGATRTARTTTSAELVDDPAKVAATVDIGTLRIAEEAKTPMRSTRRPAPTRSTAARPRSRSCSAATPRCARTPRRSGPTRSTSSGPRRPVWSTVSLPSPQRRRRPCARRRTSCLADFQNRQGAGDARRTRRSLLVSIFWRLGGLPVC